MAVVTNMNYVRDYQKKVSKKVMNEEIIKVVQTKMILETVLSWQKNINSLGLPLPPFLLMYCGNFAKSP